MNETYWHAGVDSSTPYHNEGDPNWGSTLVSMTTLGQGPSGHSHGTVINISQLTCREDNQTVGPRVGPSQAMRPRATLWHRVRSPISI